MHGQPDRIEQFKADIADLKITDPSTSRDHLAARLGVAAMVIGVVLGVYAYSLSYGADADNPAPQQRDAIVLALIGVTVAVAGGALYLKGALAGFLRFWLVRDLHERRAQTDRLLDGLGGDQPVRGRTHLTWQCWRSARSTSASAGTRPSATSTSSATPGQITGLIGPNGAGKTTTFNVITGLQETVSGRVLLDGEDITTSRPTPGPGAASPARSSASRCSARSPPARTSSPPPRSGDRWSRDREHRSRAREAEAILDRVGHPRRRQRARRRHAHRPRPPGGARAGAGHPPKVLLLDEPASGLDETESDDFADLLVELADEGMAILLVEHDVQLVMKVCALIHVLDFGAILAVGTPDGDPAGPGGARRLPGRRGERRDRRSRSGRRRCRCSSWSACAPPTAASRCSTASTSSCPQGTVVALLGPNGGGKTTTLKVASGQIDAHRRLRAPRRPPRQRRGPGRAGPDRRVHHPRGARHLPEPHGPREPAHGHLRRASTRRRSRSGRSAQFPRLGERRNQLAGTMSGGEQQMLAMARGLAVDPTLLFLDELSMGLAPLIVEELYEIVGQIAESGVSILVVEQFARTVLGRRRLRRDHAPRPDHQRRPTRRHRPRARSRLHGRGLISAESLRSAGARAHRPRCRPVRARTASSDRSRSSTTGLRAHLMRDSRASSTGGPRWYRGHPRLRHRPCCASAQRSDLVAAVNPPRVTRPAPLGRASWRRRVPGRRPPRGTTTSRRSTGTVSTCGSPSST